MTETKFERTLSTFLHLSQLLSIVLISLLIEKVFIKVETFFIAPAFTGAIIPFILWKFNNGNKFIDKSGKVVFNWTMTVFFLSIVSIPLLLVHIGMYIWILFYLFTFIFSIIGAYKAYHGVVWKYPFSYKFFKEHLVL